MASKTFYWKRLFTKGSGYLWVMWAIFLAPIPIFSTDFALHFRAEQAICPIAGDIGWPILALAECAMLWVGGRLTYYALTLPDLHPKGMDKGI